MDDTQEDDRMLKELLKSFESKHLAPKRLIDSHEI
jgi:hypothetical protein